MKLETENFFAYLLLENRPIGEFLTADYTFANKMLADFYELEGDFGEGFEKVSLAPVFCNKGRTSDAFLHSYRNFESDSYFTRQEGALGVG